MFEYEKRQDKIMNIIPALTEQTKSECYSFLGRVHTCCSHGMSNDVTDLAVVP